MGTVTVQEWGGQAVGAGGRSTSTTLTITNAAGSSVLAAFSFVCPPIMASGRLNDFLFYVSAVSGSPTITGYLYSDNGSGSPNASIETGSVTSSPTGAQYCTIGGFTATSALTAGTQYWVVLKCTAGTNATVSFWRDEDIYITYTVGAGGNVSALYGSMHISSTDNGSTWGGTRRYQIGGTRFSVTDGTDTAYFGYPVNARTALTGATTKLYNGQETGTLFTTPANAQLKVIGAVMLARVGGSPGGSLVYKLYKGTTLVATSASVARGFVGGTPGAPVLVFTSSVTLDANTAYRIVAANTATDNSSNYYYSYSVGIHDDATSKTLLPFGGVKQTVYNGTDTWTDTDTAFLPFALILDTDGEFASSGGSGGVLIAPHQYIGFGR